MSVAGNELQAILTAQAEALAAYADFRPDEAESAEQHFGLAITTGEDADLIRRKHHAYAHAGVSSGPLHKYLKGIYGSRMNAQFKLGHCNACLATRMHQMGKPTDTEHRRPATRYLDRLHIDVKVIHGFIFLLVLDEALNIGTAILGEGRADLIGGFVAHVGREEKHARRRLGSIEEVAGVRQLRMDGAREFIYGILEQYAKDNNITREIRVAHDAAQSGRIEAFGHAVAAHSDAMLNSAGAPVELTPYSVEYYTNFVHPRTPGKSRAAMSATGELGNYTTSYEAYHQLHIDPKVLDAQVHPLFCKIVVHVSKELARKWNLDPTLRMVTGLFCGKAHEKKGWLALVLGCGTMIDGCSNVVFIEDEFPCRDTHVRALLIKHGWADARTYPATYGSYESEFTDGGVAARKTAGRPRADDAAHPTHMHDDDPPIAKRDMRKGLTDSQRIHVTRAMGHVGGGCCNDDGELDSARAEDDDAGGLASLTENEKTAAQPAAPTSRPAAEAAALATPTDAGELHRERSQRIAAGAFTPRNLSHGLGDADATAESDAARPEQYEAEYIMEQQRGWSQQHGKNMDHYRVKWANYPEEEATWELRSSLRDAPDVLAAWKASRAKATAQPADHTELRPAKPPRAPAPGTRRSSRLASNKTPRGHGGDDDLEADGAALVLKALCGADRSEPDPFLEADLASPRYRAERPEPLIHGLYAATTAAGLPAPQLYAASAGTTLDLGKVPPPVGPKQLASHPFKEFYIRAGTIEKEQLKKRGTLKRLVRRDVVKRNGSTISKSRMLHSAKDDIFYKGGDLGPPGLRAKGRWIICGFSMVKGKDYGETASPSADMITWRILLSVEVMIYRPELISAQFDVPTAYLWTNNNKHRIYMEQAPGYEEPNSEGMVWELGTYLYGEPDAGLAWYHELSGVMKSLKYAIVKASPSLFVKVNRFADGPRNKDFYDDPQNAHRNVAMRLPDGTTGILGRDVAATYVLLQVDDGKVVSNCADHVAELKTAMTAFNTKWHTPTESYLGAEESRDIQGEIRITSKAQIDKFADRYSEYLNGPVPRVPADPSHKYKATVGMEACGEEEREKMRGLPYRQMIGSAFYVARLCHPELAFKLCDLAQHVANSGPAHWDMLKVLGCFIKAQRDEGLHFRAPTPGTRQIVQVSDANWASDKTDRKSVDAHAIYVWGNLVAFGCKKQPFTSPSSYGSELGGAARGGGESKHVGAVLVGMGILLELPIPLYTDNQSLRDSLRSATHSSAAKHIDIRYFWLKDEVQYGTFESMHVATAANMTDVMTKALPEKQFWALVNDLTGRAISPAGQRIREGRYAYRKEEEANRHTRRPRITLHANFPGPDADDYFGLDREQEGLDLSLLRRNAHNGEEE
jgi:hypothetical protein